MAEAMPSDTTFRTIDMALSWAETDPGAEIARRHSGVNPRPPNGVSSLAVGQPGLPLAGRLALRALQRPRPALARFLSRQLLHESPLLCRILVVEEDQVDERILALVEAQIVRLQQADAAGELPLVAIPRRAALCHVLDAAEQPLDEQAEFADAVAVDDDLRRRRRLAADGLF